MLATWIAFRIISFPFSYFSSFFLLFGSCSLSILLVASLAILTYIVFYRKLINIFTLLLDKNKDLRTITQIISLTIYNIFQLFTSVLFSIYKLGIIIVVYCQFSFIHNPHSQLSDSFAHWSFLYLRTTFCFCFPEKSFSSSFLQDNFTQAIEF